MMPERFLERPRVSQPRLVHSARIAAPRVGQLLLTLCPGGAEHLAIELSLRLAGRYGMPVICLEEPGELAPRLESEGIAVTAIRRAQGFRPSLGWRIAQMTRAAGIDVLHCQQYSAFVYGALATLARPALRIIYTEHGRLSDGPPSRKRSLVNPWLSRLAGAIFAVSDDLRRHMISEGFPAGAVDVIHNGVQTGPPPSRRDRELARRALGLQPDALVIGTAARLDPVKDFGTLLEAFGHVRRARHAAQLVIVGDGPERQALESRVAALGLSGAVQLAGYRPDVRALMPAFDIYVNSSVSEGVSLTILEAMAAELPVVATAVGGTPEVVEHEVTGRLVAARDAAALAARLLSLAAQPEARLAFGRAGRRRLEESFTLDRMVEDYARAYTRLAPPRRSVR